MTYDFQELADLFKEIKNECKSETRIEYHGVTYTTDVGHAFDGVAIFLDCLRRKYYEPEDAMDKWLAKLVDSCIEKNHYGSIKLTKNDIKIGHVIFRTSDDGYITEMFTQND